MDRVGYYCFFRRPTSSSPALRLRKFSSLSLRGRKFADQATYYCHHHHQSHQQSHKEQRRSLTTTGNNVTKDGDDVFIPYPSLPVDARHRMNIIFGANTDVGKTIVSSGLTRASLIRATATTTTTTANQNQQQQQQHLVSYIKPMQSGVGDDQFIRKHAFLGTLLLDADEPTRGQHLSTRVLYSWNTPTSPHTASRLEQKPCSDQELLQTLYGQLSTITDDEAPSSSTTSTTTYIETAGGVLSPAAASPDNTLPKHARRHGTTEPSMSDPMSWGWMPQADLYQPLLGQCPVVLVGDGRLGGISATLSSMESLLVRGYNIAAVVFIEKQKDANDYNNAAALLEYTSGRQFQLRNGTGQALFLNQYGGVVSLPPIPSDPNEPLDEWFVSAQVSDAFAQLNDFLQNSWEGQVMDLKQLKKQGQKTLWWPAMPHSAYDDENESSIALIDSAVGGQYQVLETDSSPNPQSLSSTMRVPLWDASAAGWTRSVGHGDSSLALASAAAAGRYGHVEFEQGAVHAPAVSLAQKLLSGPGRGWADRVFFSDSGSAAMEVGIKMALRLYVKRNNTTLDELENDDVYLDCLTQSDCYHGDSLGTMNLGEPSIQNESQHPWYEPRSFPLPSPTLSYNDGQLSISFPDGLEATEKAITAFDSITDAVDMSSRLLSPRLLSEYREMIEMQWLVYEHKEVNRKIGALILEPILQASGGMKFVDPVWQRALIDVAKKRNIPVVFDEVTSGLHRMGVASCREILQIDPDVACYAKSLTGLTPLGVTLASKEVFDAFAGDNPSDALLDRQTYMAHPSGCVAALHTMDSLDRVIQTRPKGNINGPRMLFDEEQVKSLSLLPSVQESFTLGSVVAVTLEDDANGVVELMLDQGISAYAIRNVVYIMASPLTEQGECDRLLRSLVAVLT